MSCSGADLDWSYSLSSDDKSGLIQEVVEVVAVGAVDAVAEEVVAD